MIEYLSKIEWQDIVTVLSIFFGVITLIAYFDQRKSNKQNKNIIKFINRQLDRDITIEEVNLLKSKKKDLELVVEKQIPNIGRAAILKEQQEFLQKQLYQNYESLLEVIEKLNSLGQNIDISQINPEIRDHIISEIAPKYSKEIRLKKIRDKIIILLALIIIIDVIVPFVDVYIKFGFGIVVMWEIIKYFIYGAKNSKEQESYYEQIRLIMQLIGYGVFVFILIVIFLNYEKITNDYMKSIELWSIVAIGIIGLLVGLLSKWTVGFIKKVI